MNEIGVGMAIVFSPGGASLPFAQGEIRGRARLRRPERCFAVSRVRLCASVRINKALKLFAPDGPSLPARALGLRG
jgi:hypothetical protein